MGLHTMSVINGTAYSVGCVYAGFVDGRGGGIALQARRLKRLEVLGTGKSLRAWRPLRRRCVLR